MQIKCPQCDKPVVYSSTNQWRPFCSERCKLIDLGDWIDGKKHISDDISSLETQVDDVRESKH